MCLRMPDTYSIQDARSYTRSNYPVSKRLRANLGLHHKVFIVDNDKASVVEEAVSIICYFMNSLKILRQVLDI